LINRQLWATVNRDGVAGPVATSVAHVVSPDGMDWLLITVIQSLDHQPSDQMINEH
jgi:hypothetical protein